MLSCMTFTGVACLLSLDLATPCIRFELNLLFTCKLTVRSRARAAGWRQAGGPARGAAAGWNACRDAPLRRAAHGRPEALRERPPACCCHRPRRLHGAALTQLTLR